MLHFVLTHLDSLLTSKRTTFWKKKRLLGHIIFLTGPQALCCIAILWPVVVLGGAKQMGVGISFNSEFSKCASTAEAAAAK